MRQVESEDRAVRVVHLLILTIPLGLVLLQWMVRGTPDLFQQVASTVIVVVHGVLLLGLLGGRLSTRQTGRWVVGALTVVLAARLLTWEMSPATRPEHVGMVVAAAAWFGTLSALAFLVFGTRRGAVASLALFLLMQLGAAWSAAGGILAGDEAARVVVFLGAGQVALVGVLWVLARDVDHLAAARTRAEMLEELATTDPLTGIANRRRLDDELLRLVARSRRYGQPLSVALVDLDEFKAVNDTYGHEVGDEVLVATVDRLAEAVREADLLGRWGGEEFLLIAPSTDHAEACALAERCRERVATAPVGPHGLAVTASLGVATLGEDDDARALMRRADLALYAAKSEGRDRVVGMAEVATTEGAEVAEPSRPVAGEA